MVSSVEQKPKGALTLKGLTPWAGEVCPEEWGLCRALRGHRDNLMRKMEARLSWKRKSLGRGDVGDKMMNSNQGVWIVERDQTKG